MWVLLIVGAPIFLLSFFMSETSKDHIILARHKKHGTLPAVLSDAAAKFRHDLAAAVMHLTHMMDTEPLVFYLSIYIALPSPCV